ncbi:beta strand repeat-containing protein, partial [Halomonas ventosae]|uniref:beta strand repeat-containing protein n=1 Tax=Halomonas ventosae TaxID=229007 RepID=UPI001415044B
IDVTAAPAFNENDAVAGQSVATFSASDEEDGALTASAGQVTFSPGSNDAGYYAFDGENVVLTQAGVDAINAGTELPAVSLTATDSANATANAAATPTYTAQNDGPTIDVTAAPAFNENDAVAGQSVATFSASDEEDGALTVANGGVDFTSGSNDTGYYAFDGENVVLTQAGVDAINAGTELPAVSLTATDSANATANAAATPTYTAQNDGPTIDVTAAPAFNENDAVAGQTMATFTASDEEDGALTAGGGQVTFTPGTNNDGYYAFDGENVVLTQAGVDAINAGTELPAVSLTATDSANATTQDSDTPSYVAQNDGPTIDVTAAPAFNENDAVAGQSVATFSASDEEDGALTASAGQVTFSPGSNDAGYYAFDGENVVLTQAGVDAINAGTELPAVSLTATDSANATTQDSDTPSYVAQNDGPTIDVTAAPAFNENDAVAGQSVATFSASDEEDGALTAGGGQVTFSPGSNDAGYYAFDGENVVLTQAGVDAINAGTELPAVNLTATDSANATANAAATPTYTAQNDGPTIAVTAEPAFNENDAVAGQTMATFTASDEEDGALTAGGGQVTFTPGTNNDGYYAFDGENVVLTQAGVDAINAGTELPAVSLTATDSANATANAAATPTYTAQNDGPTIDVTAAPAFNENDAVAGQSVATFTASDEEDGALTVANGGVDFTSGSNDAGYYAFDGEDVVLTQAGVDAINAGTELPAVSLTATDSANATANAAATPTYTAQNDGPTIAVTAEPAFNENDAVAGQSVATFTASDEEDGALTAGGGQVTFTPGTNNDGYYAFDGENVVLTQAGVDAINAGTELPAVSLTATDSANATANAAATPTYTAQNDGPTIAVTAEPAFNENDAVAGQSVATFTASDEEDGALTAGGGQVTFTPGTNNDGYYAFDGENVVLTQAGVDAINAGTELPAVSLTATDSANATANAAATPTYTAQNDGPTIAVTAAPAFNENDAVAGQTMATFTASDEEDGALTAGGGQVTFSPGS